MYNFYLKKIKYGEMIKNIVLPKEKIDLLPKNINRDRSVIKNTIKLSNNLSRCKGNLIRKGIHNFTNARVLTFLTLTYTENMTDLKKAKKDIAKFFVDLKKYWNDPKRAKYNGELKYLYVYEYQTRGAVHFHIILNRKINYSIIPQLWKLCDRKVGINIKYVKDKHNRKYSTLNGSYQNNIIKYLTKYLTKTYESFKNGVIDKKNKNVYDLGFRAYQFSLNCSNPPVEKGVFSAELNDLINRVSVSSENFYLFSSPYINEKGVYQGTVLSGLTQDCNFRNDNFKDYQRYRDLEQERDRVNLNIAFKYINKISILNKLSYKYQFWVRDYDYINFLINNNDFLRAEKVYIQNNFKDIANEIIDLYNKYKI